jgi:HK97 gp10 family phage protein
LSRYKNNLPAISIALRQLASRAVRKAAFDIEAHAKVNAPVDTSNLRNSIQAVEIDELHAQVGTAVEYGIYQEFGTHKMHAHPYLIPASETVKPSFEKAIKSLGFELKV